MALAPAEWYPFSWRRLPATHQPQYEDPKRLLCAEKVLTSLPGLIAPEAICSLKHELSRAEAGSSFILQIGDCAEMFEDQTACSVQSRFSLYSAVARVIQNNLCRPVVTIARMAGQYAKPRSEAFYKNALGQLEMTYRGDMVHDIIDRTPDPMRLVKAYEAAAVTLKHLAKLSPSGLYTSHEGLMLPYEEALTRSYGSTYYNQGAHFLWLGDRTRTLNGAHVEYFRGIANPVGVKWSGVDRPDGLKELYWRMNPRGESGKFTLILRLGRERVKDLLPGICEVLQAIDAPMAVMCDPMHGNSFVAQNGRKTRLFDDILIEILETIAILKTYHIPLAGIHLEAAGGDVTECLGGQMHQVVPDQLLGASYQTSCDPRLNRSQSLELAGLFSEFLAKEGALCQL